MKMIDIYRISKNVLVYVCCMYDGREERKSWRGRRKRRKDDE